MHGNIISVRCCTGSGGFAFSFAIFTKKALKSKNYPEIRDAAFFFVISVLFVRF
jgi:hypothetical protein